MKIFLTALLGVLAVSLLGAQTDPGPRAGSAIVQHLAGLSAGELESVQTGFGAVPRSGVGFRY